MKEILELCERSRRTQAVRDYRLPKTINKLDDHDMAELPDNNQVSRLFYCSCSFKTVVSSAGDLALEQ